MTPNDRSRLPFEEVEQDRPAHRVLSVSELNAGIRELLENGFGELWVEGELSGSRLWKTGHLYFTLKDPTAQVRGVMFRSAVRRLRFRPEDGLHVIARGRISVYEPKGEYQLLCEHMEPKGVGALQLAFEQLKRRLQAEGLFDSARKRPLPLLPRKIGVVTSLDGAALRDILKVLRRRYPNAHVVIRPTRVQGEGAAGEIARGLDAIGRVPEVDVVIVGRGGGSAEDLVAFNDEGVARAIARAAVPVISAVGHETDVTIADLIADVRAPTPSAAAELVVSRKDQFTAGIERTVERLRAAVRRAVASRRAGVHALTSRRGLAGWPARLALRARHAADLTHALQRAARDALGRRERRHRDLRLRLDALDLRRRLATVRGRLSGVSGRLRAAVVRRHIEANARVRVLVGRLESLSPLAVLGRGYAVCWDATRTRVIRAAADVSPGDEVRVTLHRGEIACEVKRTP